MSADQLANFDIDTDTGVEYCDEFQQLDFMVSGYDADADAPQRQGEAPFQWSTVLHMAKRLAARCPDLRVGLWQLRSAMACEGLAGTAQALSQLADWMALPVGQRFPKADTEAQAWELHAMTLTWMASPGGLYALGQVQLHPDWPATLQSAADDSGPIPAPQTTQEDVHTVLASMQTALQSIDTLLNQQASSIGVALGAPIGLLARLSTRLKPQEDLDAIAAQNEAPLPTPATAPFTGTPTCRAQAEQALTGLIDYFKKNEPGHPAPIFLARVQRMLGASFEDLMRELYQDAPQLVAKLERPATH